MKVCAKYVNTIPASHGRPKIKETLIYNPNLYMAINPIAPIVIVYNKDNIPT
jgi:hypothetical protein